MTHGWTRPDPVSATKEVIGPLAGWLLGMTFFPGLVFRTMQYFLPNISLDNRFMCKLLIFKYCTRGFRLNNSLNSHARLPYGFRVCRNTSSSPGSL
jgi:hypothetical protein